MNIAELKKQLADGKITKEQYKAELKKLLDWEKITQEEHDAAAKEAEGDDGGGNPDDDKGGNKGPSLEDIQKMIQSETDKVRTEYSQKLKDAQTELDKLKKDKMSDEEKIEYERKQWEAERDLKEKELQEREVKLHTVDKLRELELPLEFRDILAGADVEKTDERIKAFQGQWQKAIKTAVDAKFKENGDDPNKKKGGSGDVKNPWSQEHFNLTKQAEILKSDPELAKQLKAQAGQ